MVLLLLLVKGRDNHLFYFLFPTASPAALSKEASPALPIFSLSPGSGQSVIWQSSVYSQEPLTLYYADKVFTIGTFTMLFKWSPCKAHDPDLGILISPLSWVTLIG